MYRVLYEQPLPLADHALYDVILRALQKDQAPAFRVCLTLSMRCWAKSGQRPDSQLCRPVSARRFRVFG